MGYESEANFGIGVMINSDSISEETLHANHQDEVIDYIKEVIIPKAAKIGLDLRAYLIGYAPGDGDMEVLLCLKDPDILGGLQDFNDELLDFLDEEKVPFHGDEISLVGDVYTG